MTNCNVRYVGLDVHKRVVEACIVDARPARSSTANGSP